MAVGPAYHPEWLVTFWLSTPVLKMLNPHYLLIIFGAGFLIRFFLKKKAEIPDTEDQRFRHLLSKKNVIEEQLNGLEEKFEAVEITKEDYMKSLKDYQKLLEQVKEELQQYT